MTRRSVLGLLTMLVAAAAAGAALSAATCANGPAVPTVPGDAAVQVLPAAAPRADYGLPVVFAEIASTARARRRGLGGRPRLATDGGMLFVYREAAPRLFWMKDCAISLDIAFLGDDGRILRLATLPPGAGRVGDDVPSVRSEFPVRYVLETEAGWFSRHGVGEGDRVEFETVVAAVNPE